MAVHGRTSSPDYAADVPRDCGDDAKELFGAYRDSLGPAASWQAGAQGRDRMSVERPSRRVPRACH